MIDFGALVPSFTAAALDGNPRYSFDSAAGRPMVLLFMGSAGWEPCRDALALLARHADMFDDRRAVFFGVTVDPADALEKRIAQRLPGIRWFLDYDGSVSRLYGASEEREGRHHYAPYWLVVDSALRAVCRAPVHEGERIFAALAALIAREAAQPQHAPVLIAERVFEPELCRDLIELYERHGGSESGFMRQEGGRTVGRIDPNFKRRRDYLITDEALQQDLVRRLRTRLAPQIAKAFQFQATRIERWLVACYDAETGGFFLPHRDNTTSGTAHRKFACTINLNAEDYEGGELRFPEFGSRSYRASTGGAVVFSCGLLHEAMPVTRGRRYAFLPFLYDEQGAAIRRRNAGTIVGSEEGRIAGEQHATDQVPDTA